MIFSKLKILSVIFVGLLLFNNFRLANKVNKLNEQVAISMNNAEAWEDIANKSVEKSRVLQLNIEEFKHSNDSLIKLANEQQKELKIKDKQLRQVSSVETAIRDTTVKIVPIENKDFAIEIKPNQLTTINVTRKDSVLTHTMEILNHQDLFVYEEKVWRNQYKNFFQRLIHFDFKKDKISKYQIINSNNLIKVLDTRIINISE